MKIHYLNNHLDKAKLQGEANFLQEMSNAQYRLQVMVYEYRLNIRDVLNGTETEIDKQKRCDEMLNLLSSIKGDINFILNLGDYEL